MKSRAVLILAVLSVIFFVGMIGSCGTAHRQKVARDKEMAQRMDLEEKAANFTKEKAGLEEKLNAAAQELEKEKAAQEVTKKALLQEQMVNKSLTDNLEKLTKLKETLEEDLKEAQAGKAPKTKK